MRSSRWVRATGQRGRQAALAFALIGASVVYARPARAELELRWDAPPNCPQRDEVFERIRKLAGSTLDETVGLTVEGSIAPAGDRYRLTLVVRSGTDARERAITSDSCADLTGAAAVAVALLLGVDASAIEERDHDAAAAGAAAADASKKDGADASKKEGAQDQKKPVETPPVKSPDDSAERWALLFRVPIGSADFGPLPRPALGVGLGAGLRYDTWRFVMSGRISLSQSVTDTDAGGDFGAELERMTGELAICRGFRDERWEISPCIGVAIEHLNAQGFGEGISPSSERATWLAPGAGAVGHFYALESLAFFMSATGYVELARPRLVIEGFGEVAQLKSVALGATIGVEWIL